MSHPTQSTGRSAYTIFCNYSSLFSCSFLFSESTIFSSIFRDDGGGSRCCWISASIPSSSASLKVQAALLFGLRISDSTSSWP